MPLEVSFQGPFLTYKGGCEYRRSNKVMHTGVSVALVSFVQRFDGKARVRREIQVVEFWKWIVGIRIRRRRIGIAVQRAGSLPSKHVLYLITIPITLWLWQFLSWIVPAFLLPHHLNQLFERLCLKHALDIWLLAFMTKSKGSLLHLRRNILFRSLQNSSFDIASDNCPLTAIIYCIVSSLYKLVLRLLHQRWEHSFL